MSALTPNAADSGGWQPDVEPRTMPCPKCSGRGDVQTGGTQYHSMWECCPTCNGSGRVPYEPSVELDEDD